MVAFLLVAALTILTPDGALSAAAGPGSLGARAEAPDSRSEPGYITPIDELDSGVAPSDLGSSGTVTVTVTVLPAAPQTVIPVYRFYSPRSGTHFYTPSPEERDMVLATWPGIWHYEGVAYTVNPAKNTQPLYRFYNRKIGSHFYTADSSEAAYIMATLAHTYSYDGQTYAVNQAPVSNSVPVYRFYNVRNGSHFYTADWAERDTVMATLGSIYRYEGPCFYLGK